MPEHKVVPRKAFYYGCWDRPGHFMRAAEGLGLRYSKAEREFTEKNPWGYEVDSGLCPDGPEIQGRALLHHKDDWTVLSFWDRSVDKRGKCNSNFLLEGTLSFDEALAEAKRLFPTVFARFQFEVVQYA